MVDTPSPPFVSIPACFAQVVARHADRVAVSTLNLQWTYTELDQRSNALALQILDRPGNASEPVALLMEHGAPLIAAILGTLKAGRIYLALDPSDAAARLTAMLGDARARMLLTDKANSPLARSLASDRLAVVEMADPAVTGSASAIPVEVPPQAGAWLMYTSGSTGAPKGVWRDHCGVVHHSAVYRDLILLTPDDRLSLLTSCSLAASATPLFAALLNGAALCPFHVRSEGVERLAHWLRQQHISVYHSAPTVFRHLMRRVGDSHSLASLRLIRLGGESVLQSDLGTYRQHCPPECLLMHALSSTETGLISALMMDQQRALPLGRVPVGRPVRGVEVVLVDAQGHPVSAGQEGRIAVRSAHLAQGYWLQPEATAEAFRRETPHSQTRVFVTGDLGQLRPDGCLVHLGRVDHQVKIHGHRVDLAEVEAALRATDLVREAAVTAPEAETGERRLVAYVVPHTGIEATPEACRRLLRKSLPDHALPSVFVPLARLPQTPGGKVDRQQLPPPRHRARDLARHRPLPRDGIERKLVRIWQSVLGFSPVGRHDDFFELGGASLESVQILLLIEETFSVALPPSALAEHSTIEKLAALVADSALIPSPRPLVVLRASTGGRPLFLIHSGQGDVATYGQLARRLGDRPIYGLQSIGLHGESWPLMSIPAMAQRYLREIIATDPTGPYLLAGTCMGGLVAFETAQQLVRLGRPVGLVALLDSPAPPYSGRRSRFSEAALDPVRDALRILRWSIVRALGWGRGAGWLPGYRRFVANMNGRAVQFYRPAFYPGTITLILSADEPCAKEDRRPLMSRYARETRTFTVPGTRAGLFVRPAVDELARRLQACLDNARQIALQ